MFEKVLVASRGEIACRVMRTLRRLEVDPVAVYAQADRGAPHLALAAEAVCVAAAPGRSHPDAAAVLFAARESGARAVHPGYATPDGAADFADAYESAGIAFLGPTPEQIRLFGRPDSARSLAAAAGIPLLPVDAAPADGATWAGRARRIQVQIFGDGGGRVVALGERDASVRHGDATLIVEAPASRLTEATRATLAEAAVRLAVSVSYRSAGTVEFLVDADTGDFRFLGLHAGLQAEHGVTEQVTGIDLVEWMVRLAAGDTSMLDAPPAASGHALQAHLRAEDPARDFRPSAGTLTHVAFPDDVRVDAWVASGSEVSPPADLLLAKLTVRADSRAGAVDRLRGALARTRLAGIETNADYLAQVAATEHFRAARVDGTSLAGLAHRPSTVEVLRPGVLTTVQDYPGRVGYWSVGVPPSGPMDDLAFRLGNRLLGNDEGAAGLEITLSGPTLRFDREAVVCLAGARMSATLDGSPVEFWAPFRVPRGATLEIGRLADAGCRAYLLVRGGLDVPEYLGSRSTFTLGGFGGHGGRTLRAGDVLHLAADPRAGADPPPPLAPELTPVYRRDWHIGVLYGPHGAPDFFTPADIRTLFSTGWKVHHNSARTGVRLVGPKPEWARVDGGEAGLHPSNIHDNAYAIGAIDFTGDMPVILGPDGPSLGGFVCPAVVVKSQLWKLGQLAPGDTVRFAPLSLDAARAAEREQDRAVATLAPRPAAPPRFRIATNAGSPELLRTEVAGGTEAVVRASGDRYVLVEFGANVLDLDLRFRVHALQSWLKANPLPGVVDLTPGIRSLQVHYDGRRIARERLLEALAEGLRELPAPDDLEVPTRIVHLPLSWDDEAIHETIRRYMSGVRDDAPWCPSNIEFIRRINGLDSIDDVKRIVFDAHYLVMGLGDVYLGAPVATPLDPRHRLVTTKYNPARTWTPPNVVGIGGAYLCVYGMEGPGGYQLFGRTLQMWNTHRQTADFVDGKPWLLRFFDQIRFYPVSHDELMEIREDFPLGRYRLRTEPGIFRLRDYHAFLDSIREETVACKARQQAAFDAERERWAAAGELAGAPAAATAA